MVMVMGLADKVFILKRVFKDTVWGSTFFLCRQCS